MRQAKVGDNSLAENCFTDPNMQSESGDKFFIDLENWMSKLPTHLTRIPLIHLSIPGSHNSFSYSITPSADVSPDSPEAIQVPAKCLKPLLNPIVYKWSKGQNENVTKQLTTGVRYFDIRLVPKDGEICISHGLYGGNIELFLQEMSKFLNSHPKEVVIIDFQHFYKFTNQHHELVSNFLQHIFGPRICRRRTLIRDLTLDYLWREGNQVIVIYRNAFVNYNDICWPSGAWVTPWPNKIKTRELLEYLDAGLANRRQDIGFVSQGILTPTPKYVTLHLLSNLNRLALKNNEKLLRWLSTKTIGRNGVNVVICDFVENYGFCDKVIRLNYGMHDFGTEY